MYLKFLLLKNLGQLTEKDGDLSKAMELLSEVRSSLLEMKRNYCRIFDLQTMIMNFLTRPSPLIARMPQYGVISEKWPSKLVN
jgi:hypothetical protein